MEVTWFSTPEEGTAKLQQDQDHVNCVFWLRRCCPPQYTAPGQTMDTEYYLSVLCWLKCMTEMATATCNWWLATPSRQCAHSSSTSCAVFGETSNHSSDSAPWQPRFGVLWLLAFPKTKITFEREEISDRWWDSGKYAGAADGNANKGFCRVFWTVEEMLGELCEVPRYLLWRGLRHHFPMHNVSFIWFLLQ